MNPFTTARLTPLLTTLRQPQWIAALASLGFHGLLFAAGPSFSGLTMAALGNGAPELEERRVPLIELTAEEQSRLPDFSASNNFLLPSGDNDDLFSLFPPSGSTLPFDPEDSLAMPGLQMPSRSFSSGLTPFPFPGRSNITIPSRRAPIPSRPTASIPLPPTVDPAASTPGSAPSAADLEGAPTAANPAVRPGGSAAPQPEASAPLNPEASAPLNPEAQRASELLARVEFNEAQTSPAEVDIATAAWLQTVQQRLGDTVTVAPEPITLDVPYQGRLCLVPEPNEGLLGVVNIPDDEGPQLLTAVLRSTGYPFLNQAAEQALRNLLQQSPEDGALEPNTSYQVIVRIDYDRQACITREALLQSRTAETEATETETETDTEAEEPVDN